MPQQPSTRLVTWNIQRGGGDFAPQIMDEIDKLDPDIAVLTEVTYKNLAYIESRFESSRLTHHVTPCVNGGKTSVLIASKIPFEVVHRDLAYDGERRVMAYFPELDLHVVGLHCPSSGCHVPKLGLLGEVRKGNFLDALLVEARPLKDGRTILIGDFNNGFNNIDRSGGSSFKCVDRLERLAEMGYADVYRLVDPYGREYTYWSSKRGGGDNHGFRLDQLHVAARLHDRVSGVEHVQHVRGSREAGKLSDHAILVVDINLERGS